MGVAEAVMFSLGRCCIRVGPSPGSVRQAEGVVSLQRGCTRILNRRVDARSEHGRPVSTSPLHDALLESLYRSFGAPRHGIATTGGPPSIGG